MEKKVSIIELSLGKGKSFVGRSTADVDKVSRWYKWISLEMSGWSWVRLFLFHVLTSHYGLSFYPSVDLEPSIVSCSIEPISPSPPLHLEYCISPFINLLYYV